MRKRILCFVTAALLMVAAPLTAYAEDYVGARDWTVSFDGSKMNSNFKSAEMTEDILNIQPGDSITLQVNLKNDSKKKLDWYMTNEVLETLEESNASAEGGAYTYILTYHDPAGEETVLYSSEVIGGDNAAANGEGLHQATAGLEDYFYLDRLRVGESAYIKLYVQLDGETQGNAYQDTLARLQMNFAVEKINDETITEHVTKTITKTETVVISNVVKTGDESPILLYSVLLFGCGVLLLVLVMKSMKIRQGEKGGQQ
jgi:hypothetical protein